MEIKARFNGENPALVSRLLEQGITAKLVKGGIIVELAGRRDQEGHTHFVIPGEIAGATLLIEATEHGGGYTNTGGATVVCGLSGKPLRPYYVPRGGHLACGTHGYFSVPGAVVTVVGYRRSDNVTIEEHRIRQVGEIAWIESKQLWSGDIHELPELFSRYQAAAEAANMKANCYHCRCLHFSAPRQ